MNTQAPRGRFAPSPTGPLHFGSLVAAIGSYLNVKSRNGSWLLRMEDLDPPREQAGAADLILKTLEAYALNWDESVIYQSDRNEFYENAILSLFRQGLVYTCNCSRKDIETKSLVGIEGYRYPGTCRDLGLADQDTNLRVLVSNKEFIVADEIQGEIKQNLATDIGDFIIRRRDRLFSYQLAVVVDDDEQNISEVFRGTDLMDSTIRQVYLQRVLDNPTPDYYHIPVAVNEEGKKLSKQTHAEPVNPAGDSATLQAALDFLGQSPPKELVNAAPVELIQWATENWDILKVPKKMSIQY